jgi:putative ABC transport system permease protein
VFLPMAQVPFGSMTFVFRSSSDSAALIPSLKVRLWEVDRAMPPYDTATLEMLVSQSVAPRRFLTDLLGTLAILAFVLTTFGIYGVLTFATAQRTREIGVRMALGGKTGDIFRMVFGESMRVVGVGVFVGLLGSLAVTQLFVALLYGTSLTESLTFASTTVLFTALALVACYVPARRGTKVDPLVALRA